MSAAIATVTKMMEVLPQNAQEELAEHVREYISEMEEEKRWDESFKRTRKKLAAAARQAKSEIAAGKAEPMDFARL